MVEAANLSDVTWGASVVGMASGAVCLTCNDLEVIGLPLREMFGRRNRTLV
jgi:hypothetical protein